MLGFEELVFVCLFWFDVMKVGMNWLVRFWNFELIVYFNFIGLFVFWCCVGIVVIVGELCWCWWVWNLVNYVVLWVVVLVVWCCVYFKVI